MKYQVHQVQLTDAEVNKINAEGHDAVERHAMKLKACFSEDPDGLRTIAGQMYDLGYYDHVANITEGSLEGVFHIGNEGDVQGVERLTRMSSVSVGDLIICDNGDKWVVATCGFDRVR